MDIVKIIKEEIEYEKQLLERIREDELIDSTLYCVTRSGRHSPEFRYKLSGHPKLQYIRQNDVVTLGQLYNSRIKKEQSNILAQNIKNLTDIEDILLPYDIGSIAAALPKAYCTAENLIKDRLNNAVISDDPMSLILAGKPYQSENPTDRHKLLHRSVSGIYVRSKNEMFIADALTAAGFLFFYEKALVLRVRSTDQNGMDYFHRKTFYPDFTILIPNSFTSEYDYVYWEHDGMMDIKSYRDYNVNKIGIYADNGIYMPKNLIITMDSDTVPFDSSLIKGIIEGQLLSRIK